MSYWAKLGTAAFCNFVLVAARHVVWALNRHNRSTGLVTGVAVLTANELLNCFVTRQPRPLLLQSSEQYWTIVTAFCTVRRTVTSTVYSEPKTLWRVSCYRLHDPRAPMVCGRGWTGFPSGSGSSLKWPQSLSKLKTSPPGHYAPPQLILVLHQPYASTPVSSRAFSVAAPTVWNQLTINTRTASILGTFKTRLKTELFTRAYPTQDSSAPSALPIHSSLHLTLALYKLFFLTY